MYRKMGWSIACGDGQVYVASCWNHRREKCYQSSVRYKMRNPLYSIMVGLGILLLRQPLTMAQDHAVTFVQLTDSHLFDSGKRGTPEEIEVEKLGTDLAWKWALGEVTRLVTSGEHMDFVVFTGDLGLEAFEKTCPPGDKMACCAWEIAVNRVYEDLKGLPIKRVFIIRGNNDIKDEDPAAERRQLYTDFVMQVSQKLREAPGTAKATELVDLTPEDSSQPAADVGGIQLVGLDSSSFKNTPKNPDERDRCMDRVDAAEWDKVAASRSSVYQKRELDRVDQLTRDSGPALIFTHIPDLADPYRVKNCKTRFASWSLVPADRDLWRRIAARQSVVALFAGHFHDDDRDTYRRPFRLFASPEIDPVVVEKTYVAPPLAAKFQAKPLQARGFLLASVQGGRVIRAEFHWFNAVEAVHLSSDLSGPTSTAQEGGMQYIDIAIIFMIIVVAGAFGGFVNYMLLLAKQEVRSDGTVGPPAGSKKPDRWRWASFIRRPLVGSITLGIAASLMVPLFLKTISSDLITTMSKYQHGSGIPFEFFSFTGFCVLAAIFSQLFLDTLSKRLLADVKKVKEESQEASATASNVAERLEQAGPVLRKQMEALTEDGAALTAKSKDVADVPDTFVPILKALLNQKWSYRTVNGIAKEREVAPDKVRQTLQQMRQDGFVQRSENSEPELWFLTDKGYDLAIAKKLTSAGESEKP